MQASLIIEKLADKLDQAEFDAAARSFRRIQLKRWRDHLPNPNFLPWFVIALYAMLAVGVCLFCTWSTPSFSFDSDDVMNLHESFTVKPADLVRAIMLPFTTFNRPTGALYYRLCFDIFGWEPAAFRTVTYLMMVANLGLVWLLSRRLTGSMEMGAAAALLYSFHGRLRPLYSSNGTVCALFVLLTLLYYIRVRQDGLNWTWWRRGIVLALYMAALNAKEMAAILPALLLILEWLYYPARNFRSQCGNWWFAVA
ncbi:MAG: hypothetical protein QOJ99_5596, partial [Bryobacterales bacterium]|nr:hypothetical protein [Bryobacterales bacterium]